MSNNSLDLPTGKRTFWYRFFEIFPGLISYGILALLVILSIFQPTWAAFYIIFLIALMLFRAVGIAYHSILGRRKMLRAEAIDWHDRLNDLEHPATALENANDEHIKYEDERTHAENLKKIIAHPEQFPVPSAVYNAVIIAAYNEPYDIIGPTVQSLLDTTYDKDHLFIIFAYEDRGGATIEATAQKLEDKFGAQFGGWLSVKHPSDLPDEAIGKGANITFAAKKFETWLRQNTDIDHKNVIITTLDCDNRPYPNYFDYVTYEYIVQPNREHLTFQPISLYFSNIWDAPAPMRIIAVGNSFWTIISSMRPHTLRNFASHSQPMSALSKMDYWSKLSIVEDGHQYWRSYFYFKGDYSVVPIHVPIYQDAVLAETLGRTMKAQFKQLRRWAYGASDVPYVATKLLNKNYPAPFWGTFARFMRLVEGHITLATMAIIIAVGGWIPLIINPDAQHQIAVHSLPEVVSRIMQVSLIGVFVTIILVVQLLPRRPDKYKKTKWIPMILQWVLIPVTSILYNAFASLNAQTRLMFGRYLDKFDVTEKATTIKKKSKS